MSKRASWSPGPTEEPRGAQREPGGVGAVGTEGILFPRAAAPSIRHVPLVSRCGARGWLCPAWSRG